jgi:hypothetical protein
VSEIETGHQVDVIYTDLSKAFDSVCHPLLLKKLSDFGVTGTYLKWIISYLTNRRQCVAVGGALSHEVHVTSGVPQRSHIGPVLFILFINDIADDLNFFFCRHS